MWEQIPCNGHSNSCSWYIVWIVKFEIQLILLENIPQYFESLKKLWDSESSSVQRTWQQTPVYFILISYHTNKLHNVFHRSTYCLIVICFSCSQESSTEDSCYWPHTLCGTVARPMDLPQRHPIRHQWLCIILLWCSICFNEPRNGI